VLPAGDGGRLAGFWRREQGLPVLGHEEADGGDTRRASVDAERGIGSCDASQREHWFALSRADRRGESLKPEAGQSAIGQHFFKNRSEEQQVGVIAALFDVCEGVAGGAEDCRAASLRVELTGLLCGLRSGVAGQMDAVAAGTEPDLCRAVEEHAHGRALLAHERANGAGQRFEIARGEIFLANLEIGEAAAGEFAHLFEELGELLNLTAGKKSAFCNGAMEHLA